MNNSKYVVGIDLGGTKILTAVADMEGEILAKVKRPTEAKKSKDIIFANIKETIYQVLEKADINVEEIAGIGLGSPGPLDVETGVIVNPPNLELKDVDVEKELSEFKVPVFLENDANAAAVGEKYFGSGQDTKDMVYITISTGIGAGVIMDGQILHGADSGAGELGHATLDPHSDVQCGCGNYGCFEVLASGTALSRRGREAVKERKDTMIADLVADTAEIDGAVVAKAARKGDKIAKEIIDEVANYLGIGLANAINNFNPEKIIIGGGVTDSWDLFAEKVERVMKRRALDFLVKGKEITTSQLGSEIGVKGALGVVLLRLEK
ncbi:ROK family protein [Halanaerobacter jeridensis]|uniref:Glucokinase n=1 Tax=Halanaerobacter jeridensis TaxID=706427 RepID=A0A938XTL6_9FIRM|nr:ROK family protein [Halanaerobacter jeridensis]MBM7556076.1 glucokinase [Halanaerobacter jeridensis]